MVWYALVAFGPSTTKRMATSASGAPEASRSVARSCWIVPGMFGPALPGTRVKAAPSSGLGVGVAVGAVVAVGDGLAVGVSVAMTVGVRVAVGVVVDAGGGVLVGVGVAGDGCDVAVAVCAGGTVDVAVGVGCDSSHCSIPKNRAEMRPVCPGNWYPVNCTRAKPTM